MMQAGTQDVELGHVNMQTPVMDVKNGVTGWHKGVYLNMLLNEYSLMLQ